MIAENCNRYPFLTIARFHDHKPVLLNQLLHFLSNHLKIKFLANKKRAIMIDDTLKIIFDFRQSAHDHQLLLAHQQHRHKLRQSIPQLA